nr:hypothetical protein HK105_001565 [Polyrhizophydium stewartii]
MSLHDQQQQKQLSARVEMSLRQQQQLALRQALLPPRSPGAEAAGKLPLPGDAAPPVPTPPPIPASPDPLASSDAKSVVSAVASGAVTTSYSPTSDTPSSFKFGQFEAAFIPPQQAVVREMSVPVHMDVQEADDGPEPPVWAYAGPSLSKRQQQQFQQSQLRMPAAAPQPAGPPMSASLPSPGAEFDSKLEGSVYTDSDDESEGPDAISAEEYTSAIVPQADDPDMSSFTVRAFVLGTIWAVMLAFANTVFSFRTNSFIVPSSAATLLSYPMGVFLARVLPSGILNPGPFTIKEHVLIYVMAASGGGLAYGIDNVVSQKWILNQEGIGFLGAFAFVLSMQMIGYGLAGMCRAILVRPKAMLWPSNLSSIALFVSFHNNDEEKEDQESSRYALSRYSFFWVAFSFTFLWQLLPGYLASVLQAVSLLCFFSTNDTVRLLGSSGPGGGFGILSLSFDWTLTSSYVAPLTSPWWATVNFVVGNMYDLRCAKAASRMQNADKPQNRFWIWIVGPIFYFYKVYGMPQLGHIDINGDNSTVRSYSVVNSVNMYNKTGGRIDLPSLFNATRGEPNSDLIQSLSPLYLPEYYSIAYIASFFNITAAVVHVLLWNNKDIYRGVKTAFFSRNEVQPERRHSRHKSEPKDVPDLAYLVFFLAFLVLQIIVGHLTPFKLDWWATILAIALPVLLIIPIGIIQATTGVQLGLNVISELIIGYMIPGQLVPVMTFKSLAYNIMIQALALVSDLKIGNYLHISPIHMVAAQLYGTLLGALVNTSTAFWVLNSLSSLLLNDENWLSSDYQVFTNAGIIWGAIGPKLFFGPGSIYFINNLGFLLGAMLPLLPWGLNLIFPSSMWRLIHIPLLTNTISPGYFNSFIITTLVIGFMSQYYMFRFHRAWWAKYNYVLSIALDLGAGLSTLAANGLQVRFNKSVGPLNPSTRVDYYCFNKPFA